MLETIKEICSSLTIILIIIYFIYLFLFPNKVDSLRIKIILIELIFLNTKIASTIVGAISMCSNF
jgi:hypothetical protein